MNAISIIPILKLFSFLLFVSIMTVTSISLSTRVPIEDFLKSYHLKVDTKYGWYVDSFDSFQDMSAACQSEECLYRELQETNDGYICKVVICGSDYYNEIYLPSQRRELGGCEALK